MQEKAIPSPGLRGRDSPPPDDSPVECGVGRPKRSKTHVMLLQQLTRR